MMAAMAPGRLQGRMWSGLRPRGRSTTLITQTGTISGFPTPREFLMGGTPDGVPWASLLLDSTGIAKEDL